MPRKSSLWRVFRCAAALLIPACLFAAMLACQKTEGPAAQSSQPAAAAAPAPPPPDTSMGKLVKVSRTDAVETQILCPSRGGGASFVTGDRNFNPSVDAKSRLKARRGSEVFTAGTSGMCRSNEQQRATAGNTFALLEFEGPVKGGEELITWVSATDALFLTRTGKSVLVDASGKKYAKPLHLTAKNAQRLAFEIPTAANGLVWQDGKKTYQLEPHPVEIAAAQTPR